MGISRITVAIHWPTDILGGMVIGIVVPFILSLKRISSFGENILNRICKMI
jgi:membrane-associated phospholipid phosphatase